MTNSSKICQLLYNIEKESKKEDILERFKELYPNIKVKTNKDDYAIFNYDIGADFTDPIVQEARGIIIDLPLLDVVCFPFRKFGKYDEPYADEIDWSSAVVQEKIDGSIIKLWWDRINSKWMWSTNSTIDANDAIYEQEHNGTFMDIIMKTKEYNIMLEIISGHELDFIDDIESIKVDSNDNILVSDITYIFELTSPDNKVVVSYGDYKLRLIGARNNITGKEYNMEINNIYKPKTYPVYSLKDCIKYCSVINTDNNGLISEVHNEGFVVVDKNFNRIKVKSPIYMILHGISSGDKKSKASIIDLMYHDKIDVYNLCKNSPELAHIIYFYKYQLEELLYESYAIIDITKRLSKIYTERKDIAIRIKDKRTSMLGFSWLSNRDKSPKEIIDNYLESGKFINLIPDYQGSKFSDCFRE